MECTHEWKEDTIQRNTEDDIRSWYCRKCFIIAVFNPELSTAEYFENETGIRLNPVKAIDPRNWELDRSLVCLPDQNPSTRESIVSRETLLEDPIVRPRTISGLLPPSSTPFVMTNTARFRRCSCSAGYADTCGLRSDRRNPPTFGCRPVDATVPERFFVVSAGDRINPLIRTWINAMMPTRPIDRDFIRFIGWMTRPIARLVKTVTTTKTAPPPALRKVTRDSILSEIEMTIDTMASVE
jgi:hypothetical protein